MKIKQSEFEELQELRRLFAQANEEQKQAPPHSSVIQDNQNLGSGLGRASSNSIAAPSTQQ